MNDVSQAVPTYVCRLVYFNVDVSLEVWGELVNCNRPLTHRSQFSRLVHQCPTLFLFVCVCVVCGVFLYLTFFELIYVRYHIMLYLHNNIYTQYVRTYINKYMYILVAWLARYQRYCACAIMSCVASLAVPPYSVEWFWHCYDTCT